MSLYSVPSAEKRPLKRSKIGPPDVYHQDAKQREDELSGEKLKLGFTYVPICNSLNEYDTARNVVDPSSQQIRIAGYFNDVLVRKNEVNASYDLAKRKPNIKETNFYNAAMKGREMSDKFLRCLAGNEPLSELGKIPTFNKKDGASEIMFKLCEFNVPPPRAVWYLKMITYYQQQEAGSRGGKKSRQTLLDPPTEWTELLTVFLKDTFNKLEDYYSIQNDVPITESHQQSVQRWQYTTKLMKHMCDEQLLDLPLYLNWLLDLFIRQCRSNDEGPFTLIVPLVLANVPHFLLSSSLSRRLAYYAACKLADMQYVVGAESPCSPSGPQAWYQPYMTCSFHRHVLLSLASVVQSVVVDCPSAAVWNILDPTGMALSAVSGAPPGPAQMLAVEGYGGSPLDALPCSPSALPLPPSTLREEIMGSIKAAEENVKERSVACEHQWSSDKCSQQRGYGTSQNLLIEALKSLDSFLRSVPASTDTKAVRKEFDSIETLVDAVFPEIQLENENEITDDENLAILMLCRWAVCETRFGSHRALLVASVLEKRQEKMKAARLLVGGMEMMSDAMQPAPFTGAKYPFQVILFEFLDIEIDSFIKLMDEKHPQFASLICLYAELIRADVFSHDQYVSTLISRGLLDTSNHQKSLGGASGSAGTSASMFGTGGDEEQLQGSASKHKMIIAHLPLPQTDGYRHETNQRLVMLYGFGSERQNRKNEVKRMGKDLAKILFKRNCVEITETGSYEVRKRTEGLQVVLTKFDSMNYHDKCCILDSCISAGVKNYVDFGAKKVNHLPLLESVDTLLLLCEKALFYSGIVEFCQEALEELENIKHILKLSNPTMAWKFVRSIALCLVGYLRRYSLYLLLSMEELNAIFKSLFDLLSESAPVSEISSSGERCLWAFLADMHACSKMLQDNFPSFAPLSTAVNQWKNDVTPTTKTENFNRVKGFMAEQIANPAKPVEPSVLTFLKQKDDGRYSVVLSIFQELMQSPLDNAPEKVRQLANFAADLTCTCPQLAADWLGALYTISAWETGSGGPHGAAGFKELQPDNRSSNPLANPKITHNISCFYAHMFAKLAIPFSSFIIENCVKLLVAHYGSMVRLNTANMAQTFNSRVLGMALLLSIVKKTLSFVSVNILDCALLKNVIRSETYLLAAAQESLDEFKLMQLLKVILMHAELFKRFPTTIRVVNVLNLIVEIPFHDYVYETLVNATNQHWVRVKFAGTRIEEFCSKRYLLDQLLVDEPSQPLHLANLLFDITADGQAVVDSIKSSHFKEQICKLLGQLDLWTLKYALLQVSLLFKQFSQQVQVVDIFAKECINLFQNRASSSHPSNRKSAAKGKRSRLFDGVWLAAPLVKQLASPVKARVLKECANVLENSTKRDRQGNNLFRNTSWLLSEQPFLDLILTCLKDQDDQRDTLLRSLLNQLQEYVTKAKRDVCELYTSGVQRELRDSLQLRLNLAGGMFETVCQSSHCEAWALLLVQLITTGVVEATKSEQIYFTCIDMLSTLLHSLLIGQHVGGSSPQGLEQRTDTDQKRVYTTLIKKLRKEAGDSPNPKLKELQQVLFVGPPPMEVVLFEPNTGVSSNGASTSGGSSALEPQSSEPTSSASTRKGLIPVGKAQISPWDLIDGKPGGNAWAWASSIRRVDAPPELADTRLARLRVHTHWKEFDRNTFPGETEADSTTGVSFGQSPPPPKLKKNRFLEKPNIPCEAPKAQPTESEVPGRMAEKQPSVGHPGGHVPMPSQPGPPQHLQPGPSQVPMPPGYVPPGMMLPGGRMPPMEYQHGPPAMGPDGQPAPVRPPTRGRARKAQVPRTSVPGYPQPSGSAVMYTPHMHGGPQGYGAPPGSMGGGQSWTQGQMAPHDGAMPRNVNTAIRERIRNRATAQTPPGGAAGPMFPQQMISSEMEMTRGVLADQFPKGMPHPAGAPAQYMPRGGPGAAGGPNSLAYQQQMQQQQQQRLQQQYQQQGMMPGNVRYVAPPGSGNPYGPGAGNPGQQGMMANDMYAQHGHMPQPQMMQGQRVMPNQGMGMPGNFNQQF